MEDKKKPDNTKNTPDDAEIVEMFLNRNEDAIKLTAEKYGSRIFNISFRITGDAQVSEECENDTYMEAWKRIPPNEPKTYLLPFLSRIARNISINRCTEAKRLKRNACIVELTDELEQCIPAPGCEDDGNSAFPGEAVSTFLRTLPKEKRLMFMQRYYFCDSVSSIAKRFGCSESKVKTTLFRVRNNLREYLVKEGCTL